ncbi:hypothetical protein BU065_10265 [Staphylococcus succinus]|uniref:Uncharacterized protein n=1 Tax=Staphylococcus succinus TaxID=61015 RepID=A0A9Q6HN35_9STAP|nr:MULTISPECIES: hypothetical protein [Staphylococcus]MBU0436911.1 hypothetical protein [Staphylococcus succinus]MDH9161980.1 hypothetical protein [Staphylococcus succinus]MEB7462121.1 hypothetical protein [Staphylococcus succinus]MEB8125175.1 hypothetical protein [Staphylococcus succinus]MEB8125913.1 hypothetical protein [Staphylococcus succinus]
MLINIIINIAAVLIILGIDLYRQNYKQLKFSSILIALTINAIINLFLIGTFDYIALYTCFQFILWTILQLYINYKIQTHVITQQKFIAMILTIILSTSLILTYNTSHDSYYMSIPYLAPAIFMIGAIILFYSTFKPQEKEKIKILTRIKRPVLTGHLLIIISCIVMTLLTPYWYAFLLINLIFILFILWQNIFSNLND